MGGSYRGRGGSMQGWVGHTRVGWGGSYKGGVGWVIQEWGGVGHAGVGVGHGRGGVGHVGWGGSDLAEVLDSPPPPVGHYKGKHDYKMHF